MESRNVSNVEDEVSVIFPPSPSTSFDMAGSFRQQHRHEPGYSARLRAKSVKENASSEDSQAPEEESEWEPRPLKFPVKDEGDVVLRKVRSVLNKISSVNFSKLRKRWLNLIPKDSVQLMEVIRLIVGKAIEEPIYMQIYSRLFAYALERQPTDSAGIMRTYLIAHIHSLLQRCATDMELAKFDRSMERESSARHKKVMLHRLIAHLFLENVCSTKFVAEKITDLIGQGRRYPEDADEPLECLCVLLTFAGSKLEQVKGPWLEQMLLKVNLREAACSPCVSKRIQFMVLDLLEMKANGWLPHNKWWAPSVNLAVDVEDEEPRPPGRSAIDMDTTSAEPKPSTVLEGAQRQEPQSHRHRQSTTVPSPESTQLEWRIRSPPVCARAKKMFSNPIMGLLNKVVPANLEAIANDMKAILPKTVKGLNESIDLILSHIINEPYYTQLHAIFLAKVNEKIPYFGQLFTGKLNQLIKAKPEIVTIACFLGEWYNVDMISLPDLIKTVDELAVVPSWIESLCAFFLSSGRKLNSNAAGKLWMGKVLGKLQEEVSCHEYRLTCFVLDIVDLHNNNWESVRSLNWITQFKCTDEVPAQELEFIVELLDRNYKAGIQALKVVFGNKEGSVDRFIYRSILWAVEKGDILMMKVTGRCIRKLLTVKGVFVAEKFHGIIGKYDVVRAVSAITIMYPEAWNFFGIIMSELYSTR